LDTSRDEFDHVIPSYTPLGRRNYGNHVLYAQPACRRVPVGDRVHEINM